MQHKANYNYDNNTAVAAERAAAVPLPARLAAPQTSQVRPKNQRHKKNN